MMIKGIGLRLGISLLASVGVLAQSSEVLAATGARYSAFGYDASGRISVEVIEPTSSSLCVVKTSVYEVNGSGNRTGGTVRNCNGSAINSSVNEAAAPSGDPVFTSRSTSGTFDSRGQFPVTKVGPTNRTTTLGFDARTGAPLSVIDPNGLASTFNYDGFGRKTRENFPDGTYSDWTYQYCTGVNGGSASCPTHAKYVVQMTPSNGPWVKTYFDALDRAIRTETQGFNGSSIVRQDTTFDNLGRVSSSTDPYYSTETARTTNFTYDGIGRVLTQVGPNGSLTNAYNGLETTVTNSLSQSETRRVNSIGQLIWVVDADNFKIQYQYDPFGNLNKTIDPNNSTITNAIDVRGRKTSSSDPDMGAWSYYYNALGELIRQVDAKSQTTTMAYDLMGRLTQRTEPDLVSRWYYDVYKGGGACNKGIGKLCQAESDNGYSRVYTYDNQGRLTNTGSTIDIAYNAAVTYDSKSRVSTLTYPSGFGIQYGYNTVGLLSSIKDKNNTSVTYWTLQTVDAQGRPLTELYGNNIATTQAFEPATGRLSSVLAGTGNSVQNIGYTYDAIGNVKTRKDNIQNLTETFLYDDLNRLQSAIVNSSVSGTITTTTNYSSTGNINNRSYVGTYEYNFTVGARTLPHAVSKITKSDASWTQYAYDANGNLTQESVYSSAGQLDSSKTRTTTYTSYNMPSSIRKASGGVSPPKPHFTYRCEARRCTFNASASVADPSRIITSYSWSGDGWGPGSGVQYEVTAPTVQDRTMTLTVTDSGGQSASVTVLVDLEAGGLLCQVIWANYCVAQTGSSGAAPTPIGQTPIELTFLHGPEHQRLRQIAPKSTTYYVHDGNGSELFYEREVRSNGVVHHHNYITVEGRTIAEVRGGASPDLVHYYHADGLGSVTVLSQTTGDYSERYSYDPFGKRRPLTGGFSDTIVGVNTDKGFTGHEHLDELGLIHMNGRVYDPNTARFMSADPIVQEHSSLQSFNRYSYVMNNPLIYTDPSGFSWWGKQVNRFSDEMKRWERDFRHEIRRPNSLLGPSLRIIGGAASLLCNGAYAACAAAVEAAVGRAQGVTGSDLLRNAAVAGATAQSFKWAGDLNGYARLGAHAAAGCASSAAGGGNCGTGAASAFLGVVASTYIGDNLIVATVAGGVGSEITGGSFRDGAVTGAFGYLFNSCLHGSCDTGIEQFMYDWWPGYKFGTCIENGACSAGEWAGASADVVLSIAGGGAATEFGAAVTGVRKIYKQGIGEITELGINMVRAGADVETVTRMVVGYRNQLKDVARGPLAGVLRGWHQPTASALYRQKGSWESVLYGGARSNPRWNRIFGAGE